MAEIKNYTVDGKDFTFYCNSYSTRNGFAHTCEIFENEYEISEAKINYLNRTWESYQYQSVMCRALTNKINDIKYGLKSDFMNNNGYKKMTSKRNEEFQKVIEDNKELIPYNKLMEFIKTSAPYSYNSYDEWIKSKTL